MTIFFKPQNYSSVEACMKASVLNGVSDTTIDGVDIFGFINGKPYVASYIYDEDENETWAVAGDALNEM